MKFVAVLLVAFSVIGSLRVNDPVIDVAEFIVGFFDAMGVDVTVGDITGCVKNAEAIYGELLNVINEFKTLDLKNFVKIIGAVEDASRSCRISLPTSELVVPSLPMPKQSSAKS
jgi:hypothetical protein